MHLLQLLAEASPMDFTTVHITGDAILSLLIIVLGYVGKQAIKRLDDHIATCNRRAVSTAETNQWIVGSLHQIGTNMKIHLSPRPEKGEDL